MRTLLLQPYLKMAEGGFQAVFILECNLGTAKMRILNEVAGSEMKYLVISAGRLIFEREPYKVLVEPKILHEYFDFREMLLRYKLTSAG